MTRQKMVAGNRSRGVPPPPSGPPPRRENVHSWHRNTQKISVTAGSEHDVSFSNLQRPKDEMAPEYESENEGLSLEDHVKKLQQELDAATAESGEVFVLKDRRLTLSEASLQDTTVSHFSSRDEFETKAMKPSSLSAATAAISKKNRSTISRSGSLTITEAFCEFVCVSDITTPRDLFETKAMKRRPSLSSATTAISKKNRSTISRSGCLTITEAFCAFVCGAAITFCCGSFLPNVFSEGPTCTVTPDMVMKSATYKLLRDKYDQARKENSQLRIAAMEAKENHYMATLKASETIKKAEEQSKLSEETMTATIELQKKLTSIEEMYASRITELEKKLKEPSGSPKPMEMLNPEDDRVKERDAVWQTRDLAMMKSIAHKSHKAVLEKYGGGGPFRVEFVLKFPGVPGEAHGHGNRIIVETAPLGMMPHAVHMFLEMISNDVYVGTAFNIASSEEITVDIGLMQDSSEDGPALVEKFEDYTPVMSYPEYNENFPHKQYVMGFVGRPLGGPSIFINLKDNVEKNGPHHDRYDEKGFEIGPQTAFAKVVFGMDTIDRIAKTANRYGRLKPILIAKTFITHV